MAITFDVRKNRRNIELRGLPFSMVEGFDWSGSLVGVSKAQNSDTSTRFAAVGAIESEVYTLIFTLGPKGTRVISLRRSGKKETRKWLANQTRS